MKSPRQAKSDERDNRRVLTWLVIAIAVIVIGALSYNFFARQRMAEASPSHVTFHLAALDPATPKSARPVRIANG